MKSNMRNPVARSPLLGKGGAHTPEKSQQRHQHKQTIECEISLWQEERDLFRKQHDTTSQQEQAENDSSSSEKGWPIAA